MAAASKLIALPQKCDLRASSRAKPLAVVWVAGIDPNPIHGAPLTKRAKRPSLASLKSALGTLDIFLNDCSSEVDELKRWLRDIVAHESPSE